MGRQQRTFEGQYMPAKSDASSCSGRFRRNKKNQTNPIDTPRHPGPSPERDPDVCRNIFFTNEPNFKHKLRTSPYAKRNNQDLSTGNQSKIEANRSQKTKEQVRLI